MSSYYSRNKEAAKKRAKEWAASNREKSRSYKKKWRDNNYELARKIEKESAAKFRVKKSAWQKEYRNENPGLSAAYCADRRARMLERTPPWLITSDFEEIAYYYESAKELSWLSLERLEVDHIVPLRGKTVSGLHVPWNLQVLPKKDNCRKNNSWPLQKAG